MFEKIKGVTLTLLIFVFYFITGLFITNAIKNLWGVIIWNIVGCFIYLFYRDFHKSKFLTSRQPVFAEFVTWILMLLVLWVISHIVAYHILVNFGDRAFQNYGQVASTDPFLYLLITLFLAPLSEELFFRGVLYNGLKMHVENKYVALIFQSFIFAIMHGTKVHLFATFVLGVFFAIVYERTHDLKYPIMFHVLYNLLSIFATAFIPVMGFMLNAVIVVALMVVTFVILAIFAHKAYTTKEIQDMYRFF